MRLSELFSKTSKTVPADETAKNAQLLIQAGFVHKEMAGVYSYLPLGLLVLNKIANVIREEMNAIGGQELILTALQRKEVWEKVGRWDDKVVDIWFKTKLKDDAELGLGFTHDEQMVNLLTEFVHSYKDLPIYPYQIQTKFRNELRSKSGIMRGREFMMKDLYSFNRTEAEQDEFYEKVKKAYMKIFTRCGIGDKTYITFATGGTFSQYSHEFQTISDAGEDIVYLHEQKGIAINEEVLSPEILAELGVEKEELVAKKSIEVGNIFKQGTKFTDPFGLFYSDEKGERQSIYMGGYGIGVTRLMGTVVEILSDDKGIVWPEAIAPAKVYLARLGDDNHVVKVADELYYRLTAAGVAVLYDDRDERPGAKFADADLMGIPYRVVISHKTIESKQYELKARQEAETSLVNEQELLQKLGSPERSDLL